MKEITNVSVDILKIHPRNTEFFDDISGEEYERFKKSIAEDGLLSPILVSPDMTIISGHQRVKACRDLGIKLIPVMIREDLVDEDKKLKVLLAANFGRLKNDDIKQRKVAVEYVKLCGLKHGDNQWRDQNGLSLEEIASQLGTNKTNLKRAIRIENNLTESMKELLDNGLITKTLASDTIASMSQEDQEELIRNLDITKKITQNEVQQYVNEMSKLKNVNAGYELKLQKVKDLEEQIKINNQEQKDLRNKITEISQQKVRTEIVTQERDNPETIKQLSDIRKQLTEKAQQYQKLYSDFMENQKLLNTAMGESTNWQLTSHCSEITKKMLDFIAEMSKYDYMAESFNEIPNATRIEYLRCIKAVQKWSNNIISTIENKQNYIEIKGE